MKHTIVRGKARGKCKRCGLRGVTADADDCQPHHEVCARPHAYGTPCPMPFSTIHEGRLLLLARGVKQ